MPDTYISNDIFNKTKYDLKTILVEQLGNKSFRADQIWTWLYKTNIRRFADMSNLTLKLRHNIKDHLKLSLPQITNELVSIDGTRKWLLQFADGSHAETVYIPEYGSTGHRGTVCVSSQVGGTLTCRFCHTGTQRLVRNLTAGEIIQQVLLVKDRINDWDENQRLVTNIVFMGMGEPLLNYDAVRQSVLTLLDKSGLTLGKRRITISTSGIVPRILDCAEDLGVRLAISLHGVTNEQRDYLVPINKKYPLNELIQACREYADLTRGERITFEYVMLKSINDSPEDAKRLLTLIKGIPAKINLIPFNPWPGTIFQTSDLADIRKFADIIENAGYVSPVRTPRGQDIMAACGQLKSSSVRENKCLAGT